MYVCVYVCVCVFIFEYQELGDKWILKKKKRNIRVKNWILRNSLSGTNALKVITFFYTYLTDLLCVISSSFAYSPHFSLLVLYEVDFFDVLCSSRELHLL